MLRIRRWKLAGVAGVGMLMSALTGCQTWVGGMTLPSGRYLDHPPQYFPQDPDFPLERELATMEAQADLIPTGPAGVNPLPGGAAPPAAGVPAPGF